MHYPCLKTPVLLSIATFPVSDAATGVAQRRVVRSHTDKKNEQMLEGIKVMKNHMKPFGCTCRDRERGFVCVCVFVFLLLLWLSP